MSVMLRTRTTLAKKDSYLVARIIAFDNVGLHLLNFFILDPYPPKDIVTLMVLL